MGFVVNGRVWQNYGTRCTYAGCRDNALAFSYTDIDLYPAPFFELTAASTALNTDEHFTLNVELPKGIGVYKSDSLRGGDFSYPVNALLFRDELTKKEYSSSINNPSSITITRLDTVAGIISGTFEGTLYQSGNSTQSVNITQGRFDVKYVQ